MDTGRRRGLMLRIGFVLLAALLLMQGSVALVRSAREAAAEDTVGASIVSSGCTVTVRLAGTRNSSTASFHVDLCPAIPLGTEVSVVYDQATPVRLHVGPNAIDVATSRASDDRVGGVVMVLFGAALLVLGVLASIPRVRRLPRPSPGWLAVLLAEVALPATFGVIGAMQPLQESTAAELRGAAVGFAIGLALAGTTALLARRHIFRVPSQRPWTMRTTGATAMGGTLLAPATTRLVRGTPPRSGWIPASIGDKAIGMTARQRARRLSLGLAFLMVPAGLTLEFLLTARAGNAHIGATNFIPIFVMVPFVALVFTGFGVTLLVEGLSGSYRVVAGKPSPYRWEGRRNRATRTILVDGKPSPLPASDYESVVGSGRTVRVYKSWPLGGFLRWEYADEADVAGEG